MTTIRSTYKRNGQLRYRAGLHDLFRSCSGAVSGSLALTTLFGSYVFLQFTVLGLCNHAGEGFLPTEQREMVYYTLQVFVILGYLAHSLLFCRLHEKYRRSAAICCHSLFLISAVMLLALSQASLLYVICSMTAAFLLGEIGGAVHHRMSLEAANGAAIARCMGLGSAAAVVLQYLFQIRRGVTPLLPVFMGAAFLLLLFMLTDRNTEAAAEQTGQPQKTSSRSLISAVLIASVFILFTCFYNETIHHLQIRSEYTSANVYSWPRLMLVPGYLLFAVIGDRKNGKYVPVASLCIMLTALLNAVLIGNAGTYWLNMCLFYFAIAAFTSYYHLTFWRLAPGTGHPAFWAPFGRMLDSAMVLFTGAIRLSELPAAAVLGLDIAGVALIILLMAVNGDFNLSAATEAASLNKTEDHSTALPDAPDVVLAEAEILPDLTASELSADTRETPPLLEPEEALERMQERFSLTRREAEVLRELVLTDDTQTVISERLSIQVRTLQNHVTRIYRKTGVTTRLGLTDLYHETRLRT